jgi:hypothetical protein
MMTTKSNARRIIRDHYGDALKPRFTTRCTIGVRPVADIAMGRYTLCWRSLATGADSAVQLGRLLPGNTIDWQFDNIN